jgi:hypothetical protein
MVKKGSPVRLALAMEKISRPLKIKTRTSMMGERVKMEEMCFIFVQNLTSDTTYQEPSKVTISAYGGNGGNGGDVSKPGQKGGNGGKGGNAGGLFLGTVS